MQKARITKITRA